MLRRASVNTRLQCGLDVVFGDAPQAPDRAAGEVAVRVSTVDGERQRLLPQLLVALGAEPLRDRVDGAAAEPLHLLRIEARPAHHVDEDGQEPLQRVLRAAAGEHRGLLVADRLQLGRHGVERPRQLGRGELLRPALRHDGGGERREALLAGGSSTEPERKNRRTETVGRARAGSPIRTGPPLARNGGAVALRVGRPLPEADGPAQASASGRARRVTRSKRLIGPLPSRWGRSSPRPPWCGSRARAIGARTRRGPGGSPPSRAGAPGRGSRDPR